MDYPNGSALVMINGMDISNFDAKLSSKYSISGAELSASVAQGRNRSTFMLLGQTVGLKKITLPIDFESVSKSATQGAIVRFNGQVTGSNYSAKQGNLHGNVGSIMAIDSYSYGEPIDLWIGDGFHYYSVCTEIGDQSWANDKHCSIDYTFIAVARTAIRTESITSASPRIRCDGNYPRNDCRITVTISAENITNLTKDSAVWISSDISPGEVVNGSVVDRGKIWTGRMKIPKGTTTAQTIVYDGIDKKITLNGSMPSPAQVEWTDFPYFRPGWNGPWTYYRADGSTGSWRTATSIVTNTVEWWPTFV